MTAAKARLDITPDLKVGALLDAYPDLEEILIEITPAFKKLRNPLLRRTVGKITTLRQAAQIGGVSLNEMINRLRKAAGMEEAGVLEQYIVSVDVQRPDWIEGRQVIETFDAVSMIENGNVPLPTVTAAVRKLEPDQIYVIITPFKPEPMIEKIQESGYLVWTEQVGPDRFKTYFGCAAQ